MDVDIACGVAFVKPGDFPALSHHFPSLLKSLNPTKSQGPKSPFLSFFSWIFFVSHGLFDSSAGCFSRRVSSCPCVWPKSQKPSAAATPPPFPSLPLGSDGAFSGAIIVAVRCTGSSLTLPFDFLLPLTCIISSFCVLQLPLLSPLACEAASAAELSFFRSS